MERKKEVRVTTRKSAARGKFQADLEPIETLGLDAFAEWWSDRSFVKPFEVKRAVELVEGGVLAVLKAGCQVNLGLATFYPRLSGSLSARDADPETEERFVRGAVKARRTLTHALERHLKAVNSLSRARILSSSGYEIDFVFDETPPSGKYFLVVQSRAGMP